MMEASSIYLRPFDVDDYLIINKWRNDPEIQKMTGGPIRWVSKEIEKNWVASKMMDNSKDIYAAICLNDGTNKMIGYISLNCIDHLNKTADAGGIVIGEKDYRDGTVIFEATKILIDYAFLQLNMNRVTANCLPDHYFAPHSLYALGFTKEGTQRQVIYKNGKYHDMDYYSLLRREYDELNEKGLFTVPAMMRRCINHIKETRK